MKAAKHRRVKLNLTQISICALSALLGLTLFSKAGARSSAQETLPMLMIPMGGGYSEVYPGFAQAVVDRATGDTIQILVLPIAYASNPSAISFAERDEDLDIAEERRQQIEMACQEAAPPGVTCQAVLAPIFTRTDAQNINLAAYFTPELSAIFILGGDQTVAMQVIQGTQMEKEMENAFQRGVLIAGTSAGAGMQSAAMIGGYNSGYDTRNSLDFGAADVWIPPERHGLLFGIRTAMYDQHFYERNRVGRLLNAISLPNAPHIGIGLDSNTGAHLVENSRLEKVFGLYTVTVLDAETYHAAKGVQYSGKNNTLSLHNVLVHLLAPGNFSYDFSSRRHSLKAPPERIERQFDALVLPPGAGSLYLGGDLTASLMGSPILTRFVNESGGEKAYILIVAAGFPNDGAAQTQADKYKAALGVPSSTLILPVEASQPPPIPATFTGVILTAKDQSKLNPRLLLPIRDAWQNGIPLLADDAGSAVVGAYFSTHPPTPDVDQLAEEFTQQSFISGNTQMKPGLGLLNITLEPQLMSNNRWGRLYSLAYNHPDLLAIGLNKNGALSVTRQGATIEGENPIIMLDLRHASLALGENQGLVIANGLLDIFTPGSLILPLVADINAAPIPAATPVLGQPPRQPTSPPAIVATSEPRQMLTRTPLPSRTPVALPTETFESPPPTNPMLLHGMVLMGTLAVIVVLVGVWLFAGRSKPS